MIRRINIFAKVDWLVIFIYLALIIIGWVNIYAAVYNEEHHSIFDISQRYGKQMIWIVLALFIALAVLLLDMNFYSYFAYFVYGAMILLLIAVLFLGKKVNGARSWFEMGSFLFQPAEFAKAATSLAVAKYITSKSSINLTRFKDIAVAFIIIAIPAILILLQPDAGSTLIYAAFIIALFRQGLPIWMLLSLFIAPAFFVFALIWPLYMVIIAAFVLGTVWYLVLGGKLYHVIIVSIIFALASWGVFKVIEKFQIQDIKPILLGSTGVFLVVILIIALLNKYKKAIVPIFAIVGSLLFTNSVDYLVENALQEHQRNRVHIMLNPDLDPRGYGYNLNQSKIAIGSGGFSGKGFLQGTQTKFDFVPEQSTDFIFCTIGEEWGFIGSTVVLVLFLVLLLRIFAIAERQRSHFARVYGYCVGAILFMHIVINISMTIGLFPVVGIPLPFFSYGGSSLWAFTILLFILINFDARRLEIMK